MKKYTLTLSKTCNKHEFLREINENCQVASELSGLKHNVALWLTVEQRMVLFQHIDVIAIEEEPDVVPDALAVNPALRTKNIRTRFIPGSGDGADSAPAHFYFMKDSALINSDVIDWFQINGAYKHLSNNEPIEQNFGGLLVDIVAIEAGEPTNDNDGYESHPDFVDSSGDSRFVFMDWRDYESACTSKQNNQSDRSFVFSDHSIGVISAAAGSVCGWSNVSSIRMIYTSDGISAAYSAVLAWHNSKPINPLTGRRNATVTTGAWGFRSVSHEYAVRVDDVNTIRSYNQQGQLTTTRRPTGGWGTNLTAFEAALMPPRAIRNPNSGISEWYISVGRQERGTFFDQIMEDYAEQDGLYHFKSGGNNAKVYVKPNDPRWNNRLDVDSGSTRLNFNTDSGQFSFSTQTMNAYSVYPVRAYINGSIYCFTVGACQYSDSNPLLDDYSSRGPGVDIFGFGDSTYTATPRNQIGTHKWGYFGGTSCAAPVVAGAAAIYIDWWYSTWGSYPTLAQLLELMQLESKPALTEDGVVDFSNTPSANDNGYSSNRLYDSDRLHRIREGDFVNGSLQLSKLYGSQNHRVFIPWYIRKGTAHNVLIPGRQSHTQPNSTGQIYPVRNVVYS